MCLNIASMLVFIIIDYIFKELRDHLFIFYF